MSETQTPAPVASTTTQTPAPTDPLAEARALLEAANAAAANAKAERERIEGLIAERKQAATQAAAPTPPAPAAPSEDLADIRLRLDQIRRDELVASVRSMGFAHDWPADRILRFAPDVNPRTQEGKVALEQWRQANLDLFARQTEERKPMLQQMVEQVTKRPNAREHEVFDNAYIARVFERNFKEANR